MPGIFENNAPETVSGDDIARQLNRYLRDHRASKSVCLGEYFTWRAAWYMMTGRYLPNDGGQPVNYMQLADIAQQLKNLGSMDYARMGWLNTVPTPYPKDLNVDVFLSNVWDSVVLEPPGDIDFNGHRDALRGQIENRKGNFNCVEYQLNAARNAENRENRRYSHSDKSTYEYEAPEEMWRDYAAVSACLQGRGCEPLNDEKIGETKANAVDYLVMKNKQTVEKLQHREYRKVREAYKKTLNSFTFADPAGLRAAQQDSQRVLDRIDGRADSPLSRSPEFMRVVDDLEGFRNARTPEEAAEYSADLLVAAEKFTKGRKSLYASDEEQRLVRDTLSAIAVAIPDAVHNPSVKPLIDRFNSVRKVRFQEQVRLRDYHRPCAVNAYPNLPYQLGRKKAQQERTQNQLQDELYREEGPAANPAPAPRPVQQGQPNAVGSEMPVPLNLRAPAIEDQPVNEEDLAPMDEGNDLQAALYGEEQPDLGKEFEKMDQKPVNVEKAYEDAGDFKNLFKTLSDGSLITLGKPVFKEQIAKTLAIYYTKPFVNAPHLVDANVIKRKAEELKKDPIVEKIADDLENMKARRDDFRKIAEASDGQTKEHPNVRFAKFCSSVYAYYRKHMPKNAEDEKEDEKQPEVQNNKKEEGKSRKSSVKEAGGSKKPSVKPKEEPKAEDPKEEEPKKEPKKEDSISSENSVADLDQRQYTQVSM